MNQRDAENISFTGNLRSDEGVVEVAILLDARLMKSLEAAAWAQGMSAGAMVRCLLRDFLCYPDRDAPPRAPQKDPRTASLC